MASILTHANITDATNAIETYESTCATILQNFEGTINTLTGSNWNGDGADGCKAFFNGKVKEALDPNLKSITTALKQILENIQQTLLDNLDPALGQSNQNPGGAE